MKKNYSIQLWRFVFAIVVVALHFNIQMGLCKSLGVGLGWRVAVEFFFFLSGFLLARKYKEKKQPLGKMLLGKINSLYPHYLFSFLLMAAAYSVMSGESFFSKIAKYFYEIVLLQNQFSGKEGFVTANDPAWYVPALIFASFLAYALMELCYDWFIKLIAPASVVLIYSTFLCQHGSLSRWAGTTAFLHIDYLFLRAFAGICAGTLLCVLYERIKKVSLKAWVYPLMRLAEVLGFAGILVFSFFHAGGYNDLITIAGYALCILLAFLNSRCSVFLQNPFIDFLGKLSYPIYLNQHLFRKYVLPEYLKFEKWTLSNFLIYAGLLILYSVFTMYLVKMIMFLLSSFGRLIKAAVCKEKELPDE